jgi:hypothetical protein
MLGVLRRIRTVLIVLVFAWVVVAIVLGVAFGGGGGGKAPVRDSREQSGSICDHAPTDARAYDSWVEACASREPPEPNDVP